MFRMPPAYPGLGRRSGTSNPSPPRLAPIARHAVQDSPNSSSACSISRDDHEIAKGGPPGRGSLLRADPLVKHPGNSNRIVRNPCNNRHEKTAPDPRSDAALCLVGPVGLEPTTPWLSTSRPITPSAHTRRRFGSSALAPVPKTQSHKTSSAHPPNVPARFASSLSDSTTWRLHTSRRAETDRRQRRPTRTVPRTRDGGAGARPIRITAGLRNPAPGDSAVRSLRGRR